MEFEQIICTLAINQAELLSAVLMDGRHVQIAIAIANMTRTLAAVAEYHGIPAAEISEVIVHGQ